MKFLDSIGHKLNIKLQLKKILIFIIIIIITLTSTGCWNSVEVNTIGIVGVIGIDLEGEKIKITTEVIKPSSSTVSYVQSTGYTVFDAVRNTTLKYDKKLFQSHAQAYIWGENFAKKGLVEYLDWFQRDHAPRMGGAVLIAKGTTAEEIMGVKGGIEKTPANYLKKTISLQTSNAKSQNVSILKFLKTYHSSGIQPVAGVVSKVPKVNINNKDLKESKFEISTEGTSVFKDGKLVGFLNGSETKGFNFVTNKIKSGAIPIVDSTNKKKTSIEILKSQSNNSVEIEGDIIKIKISVEINGMLNEEIGESELKNPEVITELEELTAKEIKEDVKASIEKAKNVYNCDIFGFGNIVHRKYPKVWKKVSKDWNELFSNATVDVDTKAKITRTGLVDTPVKVVEER